jgi:hypothetical protein
MQTTNQYEEASYGLASYQYAVLWGDTTQQLVALRRAVYPDNAAQDFAYSERSFGQDFDHYLPADVWKTALIALLNLDIKTHQFPEAIKIWERLQKAGIKPEIAAKIAPLMEQVKAQAGSQP